jgi:hypothetical protein
VAFPRVNTVTPKKWGILTPVRCSLFRRVSAAHWQSSSLAFPAPVHDRNRSGKVALTMRRPLGKFRHRWDCFGWARLLAAETAAGSELQGM